MSNNKVAKALKIIGFSIFVVGVIASIIIGSKSDQLMSISIAGIIGSAISGLVFWGFSEIIDLLQQNVDNQHKLMMDLRTMYIDSTNKTERPLYSPKKEIQAEKQPIKHLFRCEGCGAMIEQTPCEKCGYKPNKGE